MVTGGRRYSQVYGDGISGVGYIGIRGSPLQHHLFATLYQTMFVTDGYSNFFI